MSGLCGIVYRQAGQEAAGEPADLPLSLRGLMQGIASRGPHASNAWTRGPVAMGHCLLREVPESASESQPLHSGEGRFTIVFDGRIDNREEVFAALPPAVRPSRVCPDVALVLAAYQCWGADAPARLLGDFAYAVWDALEQTLFCARDPLGGRPLYFVDRPGFFAFASSDEALLGLPGITRAPHEDRLATLFGAELEDFDPFGSWYANVSVLHPGHRLRLHGAAAAREERYWTFAHDEAPHRFRSVEEAVEAFEAVLAAAVASRLRVWGPGAMLMSGGIDSASVVSAARTVLGAGAWPAIRTYSAIAGDDPGCLETRAIQSLVAAGPCDPRFVSAPSFEGGPDVDKLAQMIWGDAHPVDNSLVMVQALLARAAGEGVTSLLNGAGGDITTDIPTFYPGIHISRLQWARAWSESRHAARNNVYLQHLSAPAIFARSAAGALPAAFKTPLRRWLPGQTDRQTALALLDPDFVRRRGIDDRLRAGRHHPPLHQAYDVALGAPRSIDWLAHGQIGYDRVGGRYGIALRDVWSDLRLVRFFLRLPIELRAREGWTKYLVRQYLATRTSPEVHQRRDKPHVGWHFWSRLMRETASQCREVVATSHELGAFVDTAALVAAWDEFVASGGTSRQGLCFKAATAAWWLRSGASKSGLVS